MSELDKMSIDALESHLSKVNPLNAAPASSVLQSKTIRFLSGEIAIMKEALSNSISDLNGTIGLTNKSIKEVRDSFRDSANNMIESNTTFIRSQQKYQFWLCFLTIGLIIATLTQAYVIYWTTRPERAIEQIKTLNDWSKSQ